MKPRIKRLLNLALILGTLVIVIWISLKSHDLPSTLEVLRRLDLSSALPCIGCFFGFLLFEAISLKYFLFCRGYRITLLYALYVTTVGQYYSAVTPGASGGQPMQIYHLHQRHVPLGVSTSAMITRFFSFQFMLSVLSTAFWIAYGPFVREQVGGGMWVLIVGYVYNIFTCTLVVTLSVYRRPVVWLAGLIVRIGTKLRLIKQPEETMEKWLKGVETFHESMQTIIRRPRELMVHLLLGAVQLLSLMSVLWFVYVGLELNGHTWGQVVTMHLLEYISAAYTPLPGASGAQEAVFSIYFGKIFSGPSTLAGLLLWRFFTYYIAIIGGAVVVIVGGLREGRSLREMAQMGDTPPALPDADAGNGGL